MSSSFRDIQVNTVVMATVLRKGQIAYFVCFSTKNPDLLFDNVTQWAYVIKTYIYF